MIDDLVKEAQLALWSAYCDKKMELEAANERIERLEAALRTVKEWHGYGLPNETMRVINKALEGKKDD